MTDRDRIEARRAAIRARAWRRKRRAKAIAVLVGLLIIVAVVLFSPWGPLKGVLFPKGRAAKKTAAAKTTQTSVSQGSGASHKTFSGSVNAVDPALKSEDTKPPCVAIVVDDTGNSAKYLASWQGIDAPLTFSVFPWPPLSGQLADTLYADGYEIIMHVPTDNMPPHTYAGPGQLATGMSQEQVFGTLDTDAANVPHLGGFNNHEGGRGCNQLDLMTYEVEWAKSKGLFVVDSASSTHSKVTQACLALGLPRRLNEVFIDHQNDPAYIRSAMNQLAGLARRNGTAIGICHWFRPNTPTVVGEMINTLRAEGIHFAFVKDVTD
jgi:polysaccharide deacetylase 2 family uncharacterized protein YibQ